MSVAVTAQGTAPQGPSSHPAHAPVASASPCAAWQFTAWVEGFSLRHWKAVVVGIVLFYVLSFNGLWRMGPDSGLYLSLGRNIARGEGYSYHGAPHLLAYPGLPYLIAGAMSISEKHAVAMVDAAMLLMGLGSIYLAWELFRRIVRPGAAIAMTAILAANVNLYKLSFEILTDMPFLLGSMMVLLGGAMSGVIPAPRLDEQAHRTSPRGRWIGALLIPAGLLICALTRPMFPALAGCAVVAAVLAVIAQRRWRSVLMLMALAAAVLGAYLLVGSFDPRRAGALSPDLYEQSIRALITYAMDDPGRLGAAAHQLVDPELPTAFYGFAWTCIGNWVATICLLASVVWIVGRWPMALLWIGATLAVQLLLQAGPVPRYMVPLLPIFVLAWWETATRLNRRLGRHTGNLLAFAMYLLLVPGAIRCVGEVWHDQYRRPFAQHYRFGTWAAMYEAGRLINEMTPPDAVIIAPPDADRVLTFLSDRWVIPAKGKIPERMRSYPVYALMEWRDREERDRTSALGVALRGGIGWTETKSRNGDIYVLKRAQWK